MDMYSLVSRLALSRKRAKITIVPVLLIALSLTMISFTSFSPIKTVKGLVVDTGVAPCCNIDHLFIDSGRVVYISGISPSAIGVYDIVSGSSTSLSTANPTWETIHPSISGDKVLDPLAPDGSTPLTLYYCKLPHTSPVQTCGPWTSIVTGLPTYPTLIVLDSNPEISGDIVVWPNNNSTFSFYRFSTGQVTTVTTPTQAFWVTSNGAIIVFASKPTQTSSSQTIHYYDTSLPAASRTIVDTNQLGYSPSIAPGQTTIAFIDNTTTTDHLRYWDIARGPSGSSAPGAGPSGFLNYIDHPTIWGNRIVFGVDEVTDQFDCDGDGQIQSSQTCFGLWNIRKPSWMAPTVVASAAPFVNSLPVISDGVVAFIGSNGHIQYVTVPMQGDETLFP